jgi:hypothetical protein
VSLSISFVLGFGSKGDWKRVERDRGVVKNKRSEVERSKVEFQSENRKLTSENYS